MLLCLVLGDPVLVYREQDFHTAFPDPSPEASLLAIRFIQKKVSWL